MKGKCMLFVHLSYQDNSLNVQRERARKRELEIVEWFAS